MDRRNTSAMTQTLATTDQAEAIESVLIQGDLSRLTSAQKLAYYLRVCQSLSLNPYTKPFDYLRLNGKEILYAKKDATDQLRKINGVSVTKIEREQLGDLYVVTCYATDKTGRTDSDMGAVNIKGLSGENLANAMLKALTKAKRRVTLSICGLGMTDDSEVDSIPGAQRLEVEMVNLETGEVFSEPAPITDRDAVLKRWDEACVEADRLKIAHRTMTPAQREGGNLEAINGWSEMLEGKIFQSAPTVAA
jgi:hypothetical protein